MRGCPSAESSARATGESCRSTAFASSSTSSRSGSREPSQAHALDRVDRDMTGAELLVRCLQREGVRYVFGVPGEETLDVNDALARSSVRFVPVRHEQAAAFLAAVWGRLTGQAGVCLATLGPGATNLATGLADANLDRAPVVAITGQLARDLLHKESH